MAKQETRGVKPLPKGKKKDNFVKVCLDDATLACLGRRLEEVRKANPGLKVTQGGYLRQCLQKSLEEGDAP